MPALARALIARPMGSLAGPGAGSDPEINTHAGIVYLDDLVQCRSPRRVRSGLRMVKALTSDSPGRSGRLRFQASGPTLAGFWPDLPLLSRESVRFDRLSGFTLWKAPNAGPRTVGMAHRVALGSDRIVVRECVILMNESTADVSVGLPTPCCGVSNVDNRAYGCDPLLGSGQRCCEYTAYTSSSTNWRQPE